MNQKLSDWASIAEIAGSVAVVLSLVYVGIQLAQNTQATRVNSVQQALGVILNESQLILSDESLREVLLVEDPATLSPSDRMQYDTYRLWQFRTWEYQYFLYSEGHLDESMWAGSRARMLDMLRDPRLRSTWERNRSWFNASFREYMDSQILE
jgi:hypothetical protein